MNMLKKLRTERNLTQRELADMLGITTKSYQAYENGRRIPKPKVMQRMENLFEVKKEVIFFAAFGFNSELQATLHSKKFA